MSRKYLDTTGLSHLIEKLDDRYGGSSGVTLTTLKDIEPFTTVASNSSYSITSDYGLTYLKTFKLILVSITIGAGFEATATFDPNHLDGEGVMVGYDGCTWRFRPYTSSIVIFNMNSTTSSLYTLKIIGVK